MRLELWRDGDDHAKEIALFFAGTAAEPAAVLIAQKMAGGIVGFLELSTRTDVAGLEGKRTGTSKDCTSERSIARLGPPARMHRIRKRPRGSGRHRPKFWV